MPPEEDASLDLGGWLSVDQASKLTGYNAEYLRQMTRRNLLKTRRLGRIILIWQESLFEHKRQMDLLGTQKHTQNRKE